jgi:hypothetical protein
MTTVRGKAPAPAFPYRTRSRRRHIIRGSPYDKRRWCAAAETRARAEDPLAVLGALDDLGARPSDTHPSSRKERPIPPNAS